MKLLVLSNMKPTAKLPAFGVFVGNQVEQLHKQDLISQLKFIGVTSNSKGKIQLLRKYGAMMMELFSQAIFTRHRYDVVHVHYFFPTIWYALVYKLLRNWQAKIVVTFHGSDVQLHQQPGWAYRLASRFVDHHIFVSQGLANDYFKSVEAQDQSILSAGFLDVFVPPAKRVAKHFDLLIVGAVTELKGLDRLVPLLESIEKPLRVGVIGEGALLESLQAYQSDRHHLSVLGRCDPESIKSHMQQSRFLLSLSRHESFGLVIAEAMACGTPVLATDTNGAKAQLKVEYNGFVLDNLAAINNFCETNSRVISHCVHSIDDEKYHQLSLNAIHSAEPYRMSRVIDSLMAIYHKV